MTEGTTMYRTAAVLAVGLVLVFMGLIGMAMFGVRLSP